MDNKTLFSKTPPTRLFLMAALPGAIGMLASALYQMMDGVFVGRLLGENAFAAPSLFLQRSKKRPAKQKNFRKFT